MDPSNFQSMKHLKLCESSSCTDLPGLDTGDTRILDTGILGYRIQGYWIQGYWDTGYRDPGCRDTGIQDTGILAY